MPLIDDLFPKVYPLPDFICSPFLARGGITLIHGRKSLGKSPFSWELCRCVANELPFLGFQTVRGKVLFLEKDTPEQLSMTRLQQMPEPRGGWYVEFLTQTSIDLAVVHPGIVKLRGFEERWGPFDLVVWNPLMRWYHGESRDVVARVYDNMTNIFPQAGHLVVSHDRKQSRDPEAHTVDSEEHSGWQEWVNLAQNVFRMTSHGDYLELIHTGSQVAEKHAPIRFVLTHNNSSVAPWERIAGVAGLVAAAPGRTKRERVAHVAKQTGKGEATVWRALKDEGDPDTEAPTP